MPPKGHTAAEKDKKLVEYDVDDDDESAVASGDAGVKSTPFTDEAYLSEHGHSTFPKVSAHYLKEQGEKTETNNYNTTIKKQGCY